MEKRFDLSDKCNGLHSGTKFYEKDLHGGVKLEYHEHPDTHELVVVRTWYVSDGQDDVMPEFEVESVSEPIVCEIMQRLVSIENRIKNCVFPV